MYFRYFCDPSRDGMMSLGSVPQSGNSKVFGQPVTSTTAPISSDFSPTPFVSDFFVSLVSGMSDQQKLEEEKSPWRLVYFRVIILIVSTLASTMAVANTMVLNFTIVEMIERNSSGNATVSQIPKLSWVPAQEGSALASFAWGALIGIVPLSYILQRFGSHSVFTVASLIGAFMTILSPVVVVRSYHFFLVTRVLQGVGYSVALPMLASMTSAWAGASENGRFMGVASCLFNIAPVISMPIAGLATASPMGWPLAYYLIGGLSVVTTVIWAILYRQKPDDHPWLHKDELKVIINASESRLTTGGRHHIPLGPMMKSPAVWAIIIATMGNMIGVQLMFIYMPTYLKKVMNFDLRSTGFLSAIPNICHVIVKLIIGFMSDKMTFCGPCKDSETFKVRLFNTIAFVGMALAYVGLSFMQSEHDGPLALVLMCLALALLGTNVGSFFKSVMLVAQHYSSIVMGMVQLTTNLVILAMPYAITAATQPHLGTVEEIFHQWRIIFLSCAGFLLVTNVFFCLFGSGRPDKWALGDSLPM